MQGHGEGQVSEGSRLPLVEPLPWGCACVFTGGVYFADYVLALEAEIRNLKCKFKALEEQLGDTLEASKMPPSHTDGPPSTRPAAGAAGESRLGSRLCPSRPVFALN